MNRRNFLKALGIGGGASALSACGLDNNRYYTPIENVVPYVTRPDQIVAGTPTFFATSALSGPNAYPVLGVNREGRVINLGGNHKAPVMPSVSKFSFFELQRHYSPDRYRAPQSGGAAGQPVAWDAALTQLADAVRAARGAGRQVAYFGPYRGPAYTAAIDAFTGGNAVFWEPQGRDAEARASELMFGRRVLPRYDVSDATYVLSFGADFLGGLWGGQLTQGEYARARSVEGGTIARFGLCTPHRDQTGANADDWYACLPGSEALVARAVARLVAEKKGYSGPATAWLEGADATAAATAAGIEPAFIEEMATRLAAGPSIALPGGVAGASAAATELALAVYLINIVSGAPGFGLGGFQGRVDGIDRVERLIADMNAGTVAVLLVDEVVNPAFTLPADMGFAAALGKVDLSVALSSHPDETSANVKLVLPTHDVFEDWGDEEPIAGLRMVRQPAGAPLYDTRSLGDILLGTWRTLDAAGAPAQATWREYVQQRWLASLSGVTPATGPGAYGQPTNGAATPEGTTAPEPGATTPAVDGTDAPATGSATPDGTAGAAPAVAAAVTPTTELARRWEQVLSDGFLAGPAFGAQVPATITGTAPTWSGAAAMAGAGEYYLHVFPHSHLGDGRYANQPWAQEVPDPMTGHVWDTWVQIHPDTAAKLGVKDGEALAVTTGAGTINLGVEITPAARPEILAVPFGNGHLEASGRYAKYGANVVSVLTYVKDAQNGTFAWQQAKVTAAATGARSDVWSTFGGDNDNDRRFVGLVAAEEYAAKGDADAGETRSAGALILDFGEPEWDHRLTKAGITDFYGTPDHPHYRWGMSIDTNTCTGCGACAVACYAENNIAVVGKTNVREGREMGWLRVNRYWKPERAEDGTNTDSVKAYFVPMMCQHCAHAPCESVCPVLATYHTIEGLNAMVYNRCVGTRYCSNACPYSVRRFNYHSYKWPEPFNLQLNPDVSTRTMGVMEKCTFCVQRLRRSRIVWKDKGHTDLLPDDAVTRITACADACPSGAITFGNLRDGEGRVARLRRSGRVYFPIWEVNTFPAVHYLGRATFSRKAAVRHHGHGGAAEHGASSGAHGAEHGNTEHAPAEPASH